MLKTVKDVLKQEIIGKKNVIFPSRPSSRRGFQLAVPACPVLCQDFELVLLSLCALFQKVALSSPVGNISANSVIKNLEKPQNFCTMQGV